MTDAITDILSERAQRQRLASLAASSIGQHLNEQSAAYKISALEDGDYLTVSEQSLLEESISGLLMVIFLSRLDKADV